MEMPSSYMMSNSHSVNGGLPKGRIIEIYGPESSGKTTFCLSVIAEAQKRGGLAAFIDVEHALDANRVSHGRRGRGCRLVGDGSSNGRGGRFRRR